MSAAMPPSRRESDLVPIAHVLSSKLNKALRGPSQIELRLLDAVANDNDSAPILFQHTIFCQTCLPNRDPGDDVRLWERSNGKAHLEVLAGKAMHPREGRFVELGLPFGPKARMILMHINQRALLAQSPIIEVEDSLTQFVGKVLKLDPKGRNIKAVKNQLSRLAAASIRLGIVRDDQAITVNSNIVSAFDLWFPKDERQRVIWPSTISLSLDYFQSLMNHAVPVDEAHIAALSHSSLALDIYSWLAQRLHRIPVEKPLRISWIALHAQFGLGYNPEHIRKFRQKFRVALKEVMTVYSAARVEDDEAKPARRQVQHGKTVWREEAAKGLKLFHSAPPVRKRLQ
ncbi:MAG: replication protein RepA [Terracidiphilus sp.]